MVVRKLIGTVVSTSMQKSVSVNVRRMSPHPLYDVTIRRDKKYIAHDEAEMTSVGDHVEIAACRPLSKRKAFTVTRVLRPVAGGEPFDVVPLPPFERKPRPEREARLAARAQTKEAKMVNLRERRQREHLARQEAARARREAAGSSE